MSKRKAEPVMGLFADYGTDDDEEESEHEGSPGAKPAGNLLLGYGDDEEDNASVGPTSPDVDRSAQAAGTNEAPVGATPADSDAAGSSPRGAGLESAGDAPGTSSVAPDGGVIVEAGDGAVASQDQRQQQQQGADDEYLLLPPELRDPPPGEPPPEAKAKVERIFRAQQGSGRLLSRELKASRDYQNPDFLRKMVDFFGIRERGSCFPTDVFDPDGLPREDRVGELRRQWQQLDARRAKERAERKAVDFKAGGVQPPTSTAGGLHGASLSTAAAIAQAQAKASLLAAAKKTKWDLTQK